MFADLEHPGDLREFLWLYGADAGARPACIPLASVFAWLQDRQDTREDAVVVAQELSTAFPDPTKAGALKRDLLAPLSLQKALSPTPGQMFALLSALCTTTAGLAFSLTPPDGEGLVSWLWRQDAARVGSLASEILGAEQSPIGECILDAICASSRLDALIPIARRNRGLLYSLVTRHPEVAERLDLWSGARSAHEEVLQAISALQHNPNFVVSRVVAAALKSGASDIADAVIERLGDEAVAAALEALAQEESIPEWWGPDWTRSLSTRVNVVDRWLKAQSHVSGAQALVVFPLSQVVASVLPHWNGDVIAGLGRSIAIASEPERLDCMSSMFVASLSENCPRERAELIVELTFSPLYSGLLGSSLSSAARHRLEVGLPHLGWWDDWDMCLRMVACVTAGLLERDWSAAALFRIARDPIQLERILRRTVKAKHGKKWVRSLVEEWSDSPKLSREQRQVLADL